MPNIPESMLKKAVLLDDIYFILDYKRLSFSMSRPPFKEKHRVHLSTPPRPLEVGSQSLSCEDFLSSSSWPLGLLDVMLGSQPGEAAAAPRTALRSSERDKWGQH